MLGLALGITYNDKTVFFGSAGTTEGGKGERPTMDTVFSVGSVTKIFTTCLLFPQRKRTNTSDAGGSSPAPPCEQ